MEQDCIDLGLPNLTNECNADPICGQFNRQFNRQVYEKLTCSKMSFFSWVYLCCNIAYCIAYCNCNIAYCIAYCIADCLVHCLLHCLLPIALPIAYCIAWYRLVLFDTSQSAQGAPSKSPLHRNLKAKVGKLPTLCFPSPGSGQKALGRKQCTIDE